MKIYVKSVARLAAAVLVTLAALPSTAQAQASARYGTITSMFMSGAANYAVRVRLSYNGADQLADCPNLFAYVNKSQDNYEAYVAGLLTRYVQGQPVTLYVTRDANNLCQIGEFSM